MSPILISTVRSSKLEAAKEFYSSYGNKWEVVAFDDLVAGDLTEGLKGAYKLSRNEITCANNLVHLPGVQAVIHAASPLPGTLPASPALEVSSRRPSHTNTILSDR